MARPEKALSQYLAVPVLLTIRRNEGATGALLDYVLAGNSLNTVRARLRDLELAGFIRFDTTKRKHNEKYIYTTEYGAIVADVILGVCNLLRGME